MAPAVRLAGGTPEDKNRLAALIAPQSTYRVQLTSDFGFADAASILPYLSSLGISTLYCSPVLQSRKGSTNGYDTTDPSRLSADLGGEKSWRELCRRARTLNMTLLLDIVPNHMAASLENPWWRDVLAHGRFSPYASYFDIDWTPTTPGLKNRVLLPILDRPFNEAITSGVLKLSFDSGELTMALGELRLPLDVRSQGQLLRRLARHIGAQERLAVLSLAAGVETLWPVAAEPIDERRAEHERRLEMGRHVSRFLSRPDVESAVHHMLADTTTRQLRRCLRAQAYEVAWWKEATRRLNYRRFFNINDLVGMRVEDEEVFEATHATLRRLASDGAVCGFRIDHIDGLHDPKGYLNRLRALCAPNRQFTVVEKILTGDESLPTDWPVEGTTGYEFLSMVNGIFVDPVGLRAMSRHHRRVAGVRKSRAQLIYRNKRRIMKSFFLGEVDRLLRLLKAAAHAEKDDAVVASRLREVVVEATARLPVYRTYLREGQPASPDDLHRLDIAIPTEEGEPSPERLLLRRALVGNQPESEQERSFTATWQQVTGAVMAKGFEDTTLYQDTTLLSLNDVGSRPDLLVADVDEFHAWNIARLQGWPHTLNCTATHDTKRGEDVRARLNVLTLLPNEWTSLADMWLQTLGEGHHGVDTSMAIMVLQTLLGTWSADSGSPDSLAARMKEYVVKAAREAKAHSDWLAPSLEYEQALQSIVDVALHNSRMRAAIAKLGTVLEFYGSLNSLAQTLLKIACPGIPDFYQGSELWDLALVDPDNRRPIDFGLRQELLAGLTLSEAQAREDIVERLVAEWPSPLAKLYVTHRMLQVRNSFSATFESGDYVPLEVSAGMGHACAIARVREGTIVVVVVPVRTTCHYPLRLPLGQDAWGEASLRLPGVLGATTYVDALSGVNHTPVGGRLSVARLTGRFPVCLLTSKL
ncbi:malto-oligosyltrehalose synthase [Chloroflexota bacterium]